VVRSKEKRREEKERVGGQIQREEKRGKGESRWSNPKRREERKRRE
jgi:hypothetical protein